MMRMFLIAAAAALALSPVPAACQQLPDPIIHWNDSQGSVPFELYQGNRVVAPGTINGHAIEFILDTGAGATVIDRSFARKIGIPEGQKVPARGAGGMSEAELVESVTLTIGGMRLTNVTAAVIDLAPVAQAIGRPMDVVLGRELFDHAVVTIDWQANTLQLSEPAQFQPAKAAKLVALENDGTFNFVPISINGLPPVKGLLDLGNGGALSLPETFWSKHPQLSGLRYAETIAGGVGGQHASRAVTVPTIEFAGQRFTAVPATFHGPAPDGAVKEINVGIGLLKPFRVAMDLGRDRLYLEPLPQLPAFNRDRTGLRTILRDGQLVIRHVSPQGPGIGAGLKAGDAIVAIDDVAIGADYGRTALSDWTRRPAGTKVALLLADGRTISLTLADYF